jgi:hypothetical protein
MDKSTEIARLKSEYVTAAKRVIDAIQQYGTRSEIYCGQVPNSTPSFNG